MTTDDTEASAPPADASPRTAEAAEVFGSGNADPWDAEESLLSWKLFVGVFLVLAVLGVLAYRVFNKSAGDTGPVATGPAPAEVDNAVVRDDFRRASTTSLGSTDTAQDWDEVSGTWGTQDGAAYVVTPNAGGANRSVATVDLATGNGTVKAKLSGLANGAGLVFRYKGPFNYWMVTYAQQYGTYNLQKVEDGKVTGVGNSGLVKAGATPVLAVSFSGKDITVTVDDQPAITVQDDFNMGATKVGMVLADPDSAAKARWSELRADKAAAPAAGAKPKPKPKGTTGPTTTAAGGGAPSEPTTTAAGGGASSEPTTTAAAGDAGSGSGT